MKTKLLMMATSLIAAFTLNSCLQVESTISLKKDGSGTITEELILGKEMVGMMQMAQAQGGAQGGADPMAKMLDKAKAKARAKTMGKGVEFVSIEKIDANGKLGVKTIFKFADINKLKYSGADAMGGDKMPKAEEKDADTPTFKYANGILTIFQKQPNAADAKKDEKEEVGNDEMDAQAMQMMQGMMKDMRMAFKIKCEPGIKKTNATHVEGDTITLADIQFDKLLSDPKKLKALQGGNFEKTKEALKGVDGVKFETKEKIRIELK